MLGAVNEARKNAGLSPVSKHIGATPIDTLADNMVQYYYFSGEIESYRFNEEWCDGLYIYEDEDMGYIENFLLNGQDFKDYLKENPTFKTMSSASSCYEDVCLLILAFYY